VKRSSICDSSSTTIKTIKSFKRKSRPKNSLLKHEARLCGNGGMQIYDINCCDTYAPEVNLIRSIRTVLIFSVVYLILCKSNIGFIYAFPQADIEI
jgi:hypothetical protein